MTSQRGRVYREMHLPACAVLTLAAALTAARAAPVPAGFNINAAGPRTPFPRDIFLQVVGSGHAALSFRDDWRAHLRHTRDALGVEQVRFHGIFDDDMGPVVVLGGGDAAVGGEGAVYNFTKIGQMFDFIVRDLGMAPYVELSFMPSALASDPHETYLHYKAGTSPPRDPEQWGALVAAFASFVVDRYGLGVVAKWRFEVWNEPDLYQPILGGFWSGTMSQYYSLYAVTARALKAVSPLLRVGGPATSNTTGYLREFLSAAQQDGVSVDFLSSHHYPGGIDTTAFVREVGRAATIAAEDALPFVLSEFNSGLGLVCCHDTEYAAAFLAHTAAQISRQDAAAAATTAPAAMSYWTFSDVFEEIQSVENNLRKAPFHNAYGLLNVDGIPKPSFRTLELLRRMPNATVPATPFISPPPQPNWVEVLAGTPSSDGTLRVMVVSFAPAPARGAVDSWNVTLAVTGLPAPIEEAVVCRVDEAHANAFAEWKRLGSPGRAQVDATLLAQLNASSMLSGDPLTMASGNILHLHMPTVGVAQVDLRWRRTF